MNKPLDKPDVAMTCQEIADELGCSIHVVRFHLRNAYAKIRKNHPHLREYLEN